MRSHGHVRFIKLTTRMQVLAAAGVSLVLAIWLAAMAAMAITQYISTRDRLALLDREAKVARREPRLGSIAATSTKWRTTWSGARNSSSRWRSPAWANCPRRLGRRYGRATASDTVSDSSNEAAQTVRKVSMSVPEAAGLARIEARQLVFVESLTRLADSRSEEAMASIRKLGLNPLSMLATLDDKSAQGGPLIAFGHLGYRAASIRVSNAWASASRG